MKRLEHVKTNSTSSADGLSLARLLPLCLLLLFCAVSSVRALDPNKLITQYGHTAWRTKDGDLTTPAGITQTTDGYIWIGTTTGGLSQLKDGQLFNYAPPQGSGGIFEIIEDETGTIWFTRYLITDGKGPLCRVRDKQLQCYGKEDGVPADYGLGLVKDSAGNIWFGSASLYRWMPGATSSTYLEEELKNAGGEGVIDESQAVSTFRLLLSDHLELCRKRAELERTAHELLKQRLDYQILRSVPGIGPIIALTVLAEAGDLRRFGHVRQFLKFCGLDLSTAQSGAYRGRSQLSKRGNARLRAALWMAATVASRMSENSLRKKFDRYIQSDPQNADLRRKAYTACTAKMARTIYGLIKHQQLYRAYFEDAVPVPDGRTRSHGPPSARC